MKKNARAWLYRLALILRVSESQPIAFLLGLLALSMGVATLLIGYLYFPLLSTAMLLAVAAWAVAFLGAAGGLIGGTLAVGPRRGAINTGAIVFIGTFVARITFSSGTHGFNPGLLVYGVLVLVAFWIIWRGARGS